MPVTSENTPPPTHLSRSAKAFWREILASYSLAPHHLRLFRLALEAWDRCQQARTVLEESGLFVSDRYGKPLPHPAVAIERDSRLAYARLMRELDLEGEPLPDPRGIRLARSAG